MAFQVGLEDTPIHKVRSDPTPYRQAIEQGQNSGKVVAITLPTDEVKKTINILRQQGSLMGVGLRFDNVVDNSDGTSKVRFMVKAEKRKFSAEAIEKRKATMAAKRTEKAKATKATKQTRKAS